jgi:hypothetical protein
VIGLERKPTWEKIRIFDIRMYQKAGILASVGSRFFIYILKTTSDITR